jgi:hypothetical protein
MNKDKTARNPTDQVPPVVTPRRKLGYAGDSWNSQLKAVSGLCWFKLCVVANKGASDFWLFVCDGTEGQTTSTLAPIYVVAGTTQSIDRTLSPRLMVNGIYVCASSDPVTKTLITSNDAWFEVAYETEDEI